MHTVHICVKMNAMRVILFLIYAAVGKSELSSINTSIGVINGRTEEIDVFGENYRLTKYLGIPYAESPVGDKRFRKPVPKVRLAEPLDAVKYGDACLQIDIGLQPKGNITYSEDCLFLNIYVPKKRHPDEKLAVMVWIHGGGWFFGSADIYPGDNLAAYGHVIVVTVNYRLTLWGFLSTEDDHYVGNYGLWDQRQALIWIHENIQGFGGDPDSVTIFGESAGASSAVFQGLYPDNKGLFQRIIAQSGTAGSWWASDRQSLLNTEELAKCAGCEARSTKDTFDCLQSIPAGKLHEIVNTFENGFIKIPIPFIPRFDSDFMTHPNENIFQNGFELPKQSRDFFLSLDVLSGMNSGEGNLGVSPFLGVKDPVNFLPDMSDFVEKMIPAIQQLAYPNSRCKADKIREAMLAEYTNWKNPEDRYMIRKEFLDMYSDFSFTDSLYRMLDYHAASTQKTYMYFFEEESTNHLFGDLSWFKDLGHGDEIPFVFGYKNAEHTTNWKFYANEWEKHLSKMVIKLWSNFAKTGNPNFPEDLELDWLTYTRKHQHYLHISRDLTSLSVKQRWNTRRANFWTNVLPKLAKSEICDESKLNTETCDNDNNCAP